MFDSSFPFTFIQKRIFESGDIIAEYNYQFKAYRIRYIVIVEEYKHNIFVPKFYPAHLKSNGKRFNVLTNDFHAPGIIRTTINIMLQLLSKRPDASFAWLGAPVIMKNKVESNSFTQRFRIYKKVMINFFTQEKWYHYEDYRTSTYMLVNKLQSDFDEYLQKVISMFIYIYPELEPVE